MMGKIEKAIQLAMEECKKEYGQDAKLKEGEAIVTVFNDGVVIIGVNNSKLNAKVLFGEPYRVDFNIRS